jgi:hypothetical protein
MGGVIVVSYTLSTFNTIQIEAASNALANLQVVTEKKVELWMDQMDESKKKIVS